jgi:hypothetical protein
MRFLGNRKGFARNGVLAVAVAAVCGFGATAASAASSGQSGSLGAAVRSAAAQAVAQLGPSQELGAGQTGTRASVPWSEVGPGWTLAEYTTGTFQKARPVTLYLVDPRGGKYRLYQWPATKEPWQLVDWSGDKARALFLPTGAKAGTMDQLKLATGKMTSFRLPSSVGFVLGYSHPDGVNVLATHDGIARYNLNGKLQAQLIKGNKYDEAISAPNGKTEVVNGTTGVDLVSNTGGIIRSLSVPGVSRNSCTPVRWWNASVVLVSCLPRSSPAAQLWLVPVSGAAPTALTPVRNGKGPDLGDLDAWKFRSGLYLQAAGPCGNQFIGKQSASGKVTEINVPGSGGTNIVAATSGDSMLVKEVNGCLPSTALVWFKPATKAVTKVLPAPKSGYGVLEVVAYNRNGRQPSVLE